MLLSPLPASAFIPNPDNLPLINHKNKDRADNHVENLEWCTAEYNSNYADRNECISRSLIKVLKRKKVAQIDENGNSSREFFLGTCSSGVCIPDSGIVPVFKVKFSNLPEKTFNF